MRIRKLCREKERLIKKTIKMNEREDYANWVPAAMMRTLWIADSALCAVTLLRFLMLKTKIPGIIGLIVTAAGLCMTFICKDAGLIYGVR